MVTPGWAPLHPPAYGLPERLDGLRVLDVGAWDGYWTFEALRRGAREVVAIDDFSDFIGRLGNEDRRAWETFDLCRAALGHGEDRCRRVELDVYAADEARLGRFDVVLCFGVLYHLRLQPSAVGWAGEQLDVSGPGWVHNDDGSAFLLEFTVDPEALDGDTDTDTDTDTDGPEPTPPTLRDLFAAGQVFATDNPACSCHRDGDDLARARLDLRDPDRAFADLVLATELQATGFPMVAPRRPAESYLVQTLLRDPDGTALYGVLGDPMPPDEPLAHPNMVALVRWIEGGALP